MVPGLLAAFWAVSFALAITPGADWAYAISAGMRGQAIAPAVTGLLLGHLAMALAVTAGVGALVTSVPGILDGLTLFGAGYLLWLGLSVLRNPPVPSAGEAQAEGSWRSWLLRGLGTSGTNPKLFLLFLALLPQFTSPAADWPVFVQSAALGVMHVANCAAVYFAVAFASKAVLSARPKAARIVGRLSGTAMVVIALLLLAEQGGFMGHA